MAFNKQDLDPTGSGSRGTKVRGMYQSSTDTKANIKAAGYFNAGAKELARTGAILIFASDATFEAKVTISNGVVTLAALDTFA